MNVMTQSAQFQFTCIFVRYGGCNTSQYKAECQYNTVKSRLFWDKLICLTNTWNNLASNIFQLTTKILIGNEKELFFTVMHVIAALHIQNRISGMGH